MTDLDRYLTDEVRDAALVVAGSRYRQLYALAHDPAVARLINSVAEDVLAAVLPDIIQQAKAETLDERAVKMAETSIHTSHVTGQALSRCVDLVEHITKDEVIREAKAEVLRDAADELRRLDDCTPCALPKGHASGHWTGCRPVLKGGQP